MMNPVRFALLISSAIFFCGAISCSHVAPTNQAGETLPLPGAPRINGARVFGVRPGRPFLFMIPATGDDPITFSAAGLPNGLTLDAHSGRITGTAPALEGDCRVMLFATNSLGQDDKSLVIKVGEQVCLTPPMGWNSWNVFAESVTEDEVRAMAHAMVDSGLSKHGWTFINIDDTWQGQRGGEFNGLQGNSKFPDMKGLCDEIHSLGLKAGIYSTPWITSYAGYPGGSADNPGGAWTKWISTQPSGQDEKNPRRAVGKYSFAREDAQQWAAWGFDYLKYDWYPNDVPQTREMHDALEASGRDFVLSLSNTAPFSGAADWARLANCWRTTGDIRDTWESMSRNGFSQNRWVPFGGPGHWNDPDMLVVGMVGWGPQLHPTRLSHDEQYTHISLWCLLSAPLLIGCDLTHLDDFTLHLLTNDEVLAIDQDALGKQAWRISQEGTTEVWAKPLSDGTWAAGLFNLGQAQAPVTLHFDAIGVGGKQNVRELWQQKDLGEADNVFTANVPSHGVVLLKIGTPASAK